MKNATPGQDSNPQLLCEGPMCQLVGYSGQEKIDFRKQWNDKMLLDFFLEEEKFCRRGGMGSGGQFNLLLVSI